MSGFAEPIAHLDMDAFFVEVERRRRPELRGRAVLVGGRGPRAVVASASYEARSRGAHSAMPMGAALRMCPHAVVVPPDHDAYSVASDEVFAVLAEFTPVVEQVSVDEAFLDLSGLHRLHPDAVTVGTALRAEIRRRLGLPCSVGIAATKLLAKMASRAAKPDGLLLIPAGEGLAHLHRQPVRSLWGVGEATHARLEELGVSIVADLAALPETVLQRRLGDALGTHLARLARGEDDRVVTPAESARSISVEETFDADLAGPEAVHRALLALADRLAHRLHQSGVAAGTVTLKVRHADFTTVTRSHTDSDPIATGRDLFRVATMLAQRTAAPRTPVRLLGLAATGLLSAGEPRQLGLEERPWDEVERAIGEVRDRFGRDAVERARLADSPAVRRPPPGA